MHNSVLYLNKNHYLQSFGTQEKTIKYLLGVSATVAQCHLVVISVAVLKVFTF